MKYRHEWLSRSLAFFFVQTLCCLSAAPSWATDLPTSVLNYLRQKDPGVQVRFDGLIRFSNGERYIPVIPQDPALNPDPQQVISAQPEKATYPDLVEFDNHFFLLRLIQTASGRLTFPKMDAYPIQLKEGLLPQDFVLPANLFIPVELKVILGALPYNPSYAPPKAVAPPQKPPVKTASGKPSTGATKPTTSASAKPTTNPAPDSGFDLATQPGYVFDIQEQKLFAFDPLTGKKQGDLTLNCAPSALQLSPDGKLLFAPCLSTNELVVIDTEANLIKSRVPVGQRPDALLYLPASKQLLVSNRYSAYLSIVDTGSLSSAEKIDFPGNTGALAAFLGDKAVEIAVADAARPQIYILNRQTRQLIRTLPAAPDISAMTVLPASGERQEIWAVSRTENRVLVLDAKTGETLAKLDVARKPVALTVYEDKAYVLCAGDARISVIDRAKKALLPPIVLEENSFPSGMTVLPAAGRAYITSAGANLLVVLNLKAARVESTLPVNFRSSLIVLSRQEATLPASEPSATKSSAAVIPASAPSTPPILKKSVAPSVSSTPKINTPPLTTQVKPMPAPAATPASPPSTASLLVDPIPQTLEIRALPTSSSAETVYMSPARKAKTAESAPPAKP